VKQIDDLIGHKPDLDILPTGIIVRNKCS